jgi:hypothetical protein
MERIVVDIKNRPRFRIFIELPTLEKLFIVTDL